MDKSHTQMFKYSSVGHAFLPPVILSLTKSSEVMLPKLAVEVLVLVIPFVGLPSGSISAKKNSIAASAATGRKILRKSDVSAFFFENLL